MICVISFDCYRGLKAGRTSANPVLWVAHRPKRRLKEVKKQWWRRQVWRPGRRRRQNPADNQGWAFISDDSDSWGFKTSMDDKPAEHPKLVVVATNCP